MLEPRDPKDSFEVEPLFGEDDQDFKKSLGRLFWVIVAALVLILTTTIVFIFLNFGNIRRRAQEDSQSQAAQSALPICTARFSANRAAS